MRTGSCFWPDIAVWSYGEQSRHHVHSTGLQYLHYIHFSYLMSWLWLVWPTCPFLFLLCECSPPCPGGTPKWLKYSFVPGMYPGWVPTAALGASLQGHLCLLVQPG